MFCFPSLFDLSVPQVCSFSLLGFIMVSLRFSLYATTSKAAAHSAIVSPLGGIQASSAKFSVEASELKTGCLILPPCFFTELISKRRFRPPPPRKKKKKERNNKETTQHTHTQKRRRRRRSNKKPRPPFRAFAMPRARVASSSEAGDVSLRGSEQRQPRGVGRRGPGESRRRPFCVERRRGEVGVSF